MVAEMIPLQFTSLGFSAIVILSGYIWNDQAKRLKKIENERLVCPHKKDSLLIVEMRTDIKWIKREIEKNKL